VRPRPPQSNDTRDHGPHTLRVLDGTIVGIDRDDVFVELGPRMQGVISAMAFPSEPRVGDEHRFTLRGQEEELWALSLTEEPVLPTWEDMEEGSLVQARVVRTKPGGLEVLVGKLHAFLPKSQTGLDRGDDPEVLVGKVLTCEVTEVDPERQRCSVSRKLVLAREKESGRARELGALAPGAVVQGRVSRVEDYGVFVRFGRGLEGLVHVSNLAWERVADPRELYREGDSIDAKVLHVKHAGKRIGLGVKQLGESPWNALAREVSPGAVLEGEVVRMTDYGAFVRVRPGVEGLLHRSETGLGPNEPVHVVAKIGDRLPVRVVSVSPAEERLALSVLREDGMRLDRLEVLDGGQGYREFVEDEGPRNDLGEKLRRALGDGS
jgi:small subunit ribosomal protein S1